MRTKTILELRWVAHAGLLMGIGLGGLACVADKPPPKASNNGQSFEAAMKLVCHVDDHVGISAGDDPLELDQRRADFLQSRVKNPEVIYHQTLWRVQATTQRAKTIRELSAQARLSSCPYADALEQGDL